MSKSKYQKAFIGRLAFLFGLKKGQSLFGKLHTWLVDLLRKKCKS